MGFLKKFLDVMIGSTEFHKKNNIRIKEMRKKNNNGSFLDGFVQGVIESSRDRTRINYWEEESDEDRQKHKDENQARINYEKGRRK